MAAHLLSAFLASRRLSAPDRRPLYAYRCTQEEHRALGDALRESLPPSPKGLRSGRSARIGPLTAQAFCLWAAEWWKREHTGGPWKWETLLRAIDCAHLSPGNSGYSTLQRMVADGIERWQRPLLWTSHGAGFLLTLACEGGLPLKLIHREQSRLRRFFRLAFEEYSYACRAGIPVSDLVTELSVHLPSSLRQEVVMKLSAQLVEAVWALQQEVGESHTPLADLDRRRPDWRDDLPLELSDDVARALLNNLLLDAGTVARGGKPVVKWERTLIRGAQGWRVEGELKIPARLDDHDAAVLFGDASIPSRFTLLWRPDGCPVTPVAMGTAGTSTQSLVLEVSKSTAKRCENQDALAPQWVFARGIAGDLLPLNVRGSEGLSELPWVFVPGAADDPQSSEYSFAGEGSLRVRADQALVVVSDAVRVESGIETEYEELGRLEFADRRIILVRGQITVHDADGFTATVRTGDRNGQERTIHLLTGPRREIGRAAVQAFMGAPTVHQLSASGRMAGVPDHELLWRDDRTTARWVAYSTSRVGDGRLRRVVNGEIRYSVRLKILPRKSEIRFEPHTRGLGGVIELRDFGASHACASSESLASAHVETLGTTIRLRLWSATAPARDVDVSLEWPSGARLRIGLPFPAVGSGFRSAAGEPLPTEVAITPDRLPGIRAVVVVPRPGCEVFMEGRYRSLEETSPLRREFRIPLQERSGGYFEVDLVDVHHLVAPLLDRSSDPEAWVCLEFQSNDVDVTGPRLFVTRFDTWFKLDPAERVVRIAPEARHGSTSDDVAALRVEAVSMLRPAEEPHVLERVDSVTWLPPPEPGPWMILGWKGDWCRARPALWANPPVEGAVESPLEIAYAERDSDRESLIRQAVRDLGNDLDAFDWSTVAGLLPWTRHLPAVTFDVLRALAADPAVAAIGAFRFTGDEFRTYWKCMEELPFWWRAVTREQWQAAAAIVGESLRNAVDLLGENSSLLGDPKAWAETRYKDATRLIISALPHLEPIFGYEAARQFQRPIDSSASRVANPILRERFLSEVQASRTTCPLFEVDPRHHPPREEIVHLIDSVVQLPGANALLAKQSGQFSNEARYAFANSPAAAALAAHGNVPLAPEQLQVLHWVSETTGEWFGSAYRSAYLFAIAARHHQLLDA
jgi:hypothetical protein